MYVGIMLFGESLGSSDGNLLKLWYMELEGLMLHMNLLFVD